VRDTCKFGVCLQQVTSGRKIKLGTLLSSVALALTFGAGNASADSISYLLTTGNLAGFTGPFAEVTVDRTSSTNAIITFASESNGTYLYLMGGAGSIGVNVRGTFALGPISGSNSLAGFSTPSYSSGGAGNEDGFGSFNQRINSFDGWSHTSTIITIGLTAGASNDSWTSAAQVLAPNNKGQFAAIHFFACIPNGSACASDSPGANSITGYASGAAVVPIPPAAWLFGSGLIGLIAMARRRSNVFKLPAAAV
jgi:hypothetical protein